MSTYMCKIAHLKETSKQMCFQAIYVLESPPDLVLGASDLVALVDAATVEEHRCFGSFATLGVGKRQSKEKSDGKVGGGNGHLRPRADQRIYTLSEVHVQKGNVCPL